MTIKGKWCIISPLGGENVTENFKDMLAFYAWGSTGYKNIEDKEYDYEQILSLAKKQGVFHIVYSVLKQYTNDETVVNLNSLYLMSILKHQSRTDAIEKIISKLEAEGIDVCHIKGKTLSSLYYYPETRLSGDVDLLINEEDEIKAKRILEKEGFKCEMRSDDANHSECIHERLGLIELHVKLYYDIMKDIWFGSDDMLKEPYMVIDGIKTLSYTDGFIYNFMHATKHFLSNGTSVRHITDVLLYGQKHKEKIDFERVFLTLEKLKYKEFLDAFVKIGENYFNITPLYHTDSNNADLVLTDIEESGIFGKNIKKAGALFEIYTDLRYSTFKKGDKTKYLTNWRRKNILKALSYSTNNMKRKYPFMEKGIHYLPKAYVLHTKDIISKAFKRKKLMEDFVEFKPAENKALDNKIELIKKLNMI